jgi:thiol-disulfide isomerase/thioredoxin
MANLRAAWHRGGVSSSALLGLSVLVAVLVAATGLGLWRKGREGRLRPVVGTPETLEPADPTTEALAGLGVTGGDRVTLLQFSSAFCAPCRATRRVLADVAAVVDGVDHVEIDAESHLDAVRALGIWKTPTTLVVDGAGRVVQRATGVPAKAQVVAAVAPLLPQASSR